ncbi:MAG TPA: lipopolysaccharide heptosyltransferase II, partial [Vicinamibacterales bacterium]|nr:lipopolysaccharide heptosyltransferase II [Vicinamibacterales bacterium]
MPERILVLAPNWLGDAVMALPAIADVRRQHPSARLVAAARASVAPLLSMAPVIDEVVTLGWRGRAMDRAALASDVAAIRAARPDVAILLPNSFAAAWLVRRAGVPERWGYARDVRRVLLTRAVARPPRGLHQGEYYQHLVRALGIATGPLEPVLDVSGDALDAGRRLLREAGWPDDAPFAAIAPGAAYGTAKRWLPQHFATVIAALAENGVGGHLKRTVGLRTVLVGSAGDAETTKMIAAALPQAARASVLDLTGRTSLTELAAILRLARVCISNDSGAMHVAGAVGTPVAALFGPTRERETAPLMRHGVDRRVLLNPVWCRPCMLRECPIDHR